MNDAGTIMTRSTSRKKRSKLTRLLLSPIMLIVFVAGWSLYCIGQPSSRQNIKQPIKLADSTGKKQDAVELVVIPQQEQILAN